MAVIRDVQITFDCESPRRVARFWCEVMGYELAAPPDGFSSWEEFDRTLPEADRDSWAAAQDPTGNRPRLFFQRVPETKVVKNRVHLDVRAGAGLAGEERLAALLAEEERLIPLGAKRVLLQYADDENESCLTMQDPEGNEFCLD